MYNTSCVSLAKANTVQTVLTYVALNKSAKTKLFLLDKSGQGKRMYEALTLQHASDGITFCKYRFQLYFLVFSLLMQTKCTLYARSALFGMVCVLILGRTAVIELHQDVFSRKSIINWLLIKLFQRIKFPKLKLFTISTALKNIYHCQGIKQDISVLHDGFDPTFVPTTLNIKKRATYTGLVSHERGFSEILDLANNFTDWYFIIIGANAHEVKYYKEIVHNANLNNVRIYRKQNRKRVKLFQHNSDVLLAFWGDNVPTMRYCSPLKVFEYLATGNKILMHDYPVLDEVVPRCPSVERFVAGDTDAAITAFTKLINLGPNKDEHLINHSQSYTYDERVKNLLSNI